MRIDTWPHDIRKTGIPRFDPGSERLEDFFEEPVQVYAIAVDNDPNTDTDGIWTTLVMNRLPFLGINGFFSDSTSRMAPDFWKMKMVALPTVQFSFQFNGISRINRLLFWDYFL